MKAVLQRGLVGDWVMPALGAVAVIAGALTDWRLGAILAVWIGAWLVNVLLANGGRGGGVRLLVPVIFGGTLLALWELAVTLYGVSPIILPAPSAIAQTFAANTDVLWADFQQTILKGALSGYVIGCGAAFLTALAIDRSAFLQRGLLPVGNFIAALPIVGTAPILVMWFGFGWQSKAAVVVAMVFFPMLVNAVQGLKASDQMQRDLMHTYAASYWQGLLKLRLPTALPFLFNGLKICTTLALIGAIVAEFFGSPTVGMGFRIKIEVGRLAMDMVWAEIAVAALAGSGFYGLVALIERKTTFWHPSQRRG
ncbi:Pyrimidine ABC transporter, transmembrane component 1 [Roseibacterium elongatum DSM 19469]|uniref:Pyrimidine ABC transporter, transmembrane component 1 n=1 Tax=Roseicyclus elongatus DSM 19469 TaxID=1294273 RepID=W8S5X9_9RHOB|nr:ABC transporter permease [Roseibacterium elongatum]AHM05642.1 Pyrimidine ABC transporter, transmembrane component 1 [Roseibacterium elongatum DSM 19469]